MLKGSFNQSFNLSFHKFTIMTKQQIQALIDANIAGQGNQIDISGALANILSALLDFAAPLETENIEELTDEQLEAMTVGSIVAKVDDTGKHAYVCSYKGDGGLCLTYADCENVETLAYEKTAEGWSFDDKTVTHIGA